MSDVTLTVELIRPYGFVVDQLGLWRDGGARATDLWPIEDAEAEQILNAAVDNGITFIDTASDYEHSEEYIARFFAPPR